MEVWAADSASLPTKYFLKTLGSRSDAEMINFGGGALCTYVGEARSASAPCPPHPSSSLRCHAPHSLPASGADRPPTLPGDGRLYW